MSGPISDKEIDHCVVEAKKLYQYFTAYLKKHLPPNVSVAIVLKAYIHQFENSEYKPTWDYVQGEDWDWDNILNEQNEH